MKNERGSITLFVLIAMIFFLTIAFTAYASAMTKLQGQNEDIERIKASYEQDLSEERLSQLYNEITGTREWLPGAGTEQDPYKIYTIEDLVELSNRTNGGESFDGKYVALMNDLDFQENKSYEKYNRTDYGDINGNGTVEELKTELTTGSGWKPISSTSSNNSFTGIFEGKGNEIKNIYIYINENGKHGGLFGYVGNSTIQNLGITGSMTTEKSNEVGGIVGYVKSR